MAATFFFYDLETSGINPRSARIMQFAGQRTTLELEPIGEPVNILIKLAPDVVPEPDAILITGITPQQTIQDGLTEVEFIQQFMTEVATPDTIFVGYNTVRFDDEFMRFLLYRNFYDPYEWQWKDGRSRWDLLDVVRTTRALRPDGIEWPFDSKGKPSNRLELLTSVNKLDHFAAHDALSDVLASIALAKLLYTKQPKLFKYLLDIRDKKKVANLAADGQPFVYTSGKYPGEYEKTTVAVSIVKHPKKQGVLVFDLRHDPSAFSDLTPEKLAELWRWKKDPTEPRLPVKTLQSNRCPAVAPVSVLDSASQKRLQIDTTLINKHAQALKKMTDFPSKLLKALEILEKQQQIEWISDEQSADAQLYDGFIQDYDKSVEADLRNAQPSEVSSFISRFKDPRLKSITPLYKARNFSSELDDDERAAWDAHCATVLLGGGEKSKLAKFFARLGELDQANWVTTKQRYLLEELQLYGQSIIPVANEEYEDDVHKT